MGQGRKAEVQTFKRHQEAKMKAKHKEENRKDKAKKIPRTLENSKAHDETAISKDPSRDTQLSLCFDADEFASYFRGVSPKIIVTTVRRANKRTLDFATELASVFCGNAQMVPRSGQHDLLNVIKEASSKEYTDLMVVGERQRMPYSLTMIHLPNGPTACFRLSSVVPSSKITGHGVATPHPPELVMSHFDTMLGVTVGRFLMGLFPQAPQFRGRQVVTFHNQRDYIFFRRHRYIFEEEGEKVRMQELGPRFTLKLTALQKGTFKPSDGEFLWIRKSGSMNTRKGFYC